MSTIVYQNLIDTTTTTLKLKFPAAAPPAVDLQINEFPNWAFFIQTNSIQSEEKDYTNHTFSKLSARSLELCTENLGSESGSDAVSDCTTIFSGDDRGTAVSDHRNHEKDARRKIKNFPPPLTTMSGASPLQVRRRREGGRLIIEAVEAPFKNSYLQAERSGGRLKLSFTSAASSDEKAEEEEEEENVDESAAAAAAGGGGAAAEEEMEEPRKEFEAEMEEEMNVMEKFQRLSRCKEGGHESKGLCSNWKPALWVATS